DLPVDEVRQTLQVWFPISVERRHDRGDRAGDLPGVAAELHTVSFRSFWCSRNASSVAKRWLRAASSISSGSALRSIRSSRWECSSTEPWARPGTKLKV